MKLKNTRLTIISGIAALCLGTGAMAQGSTSAQDKTFVKKASQGSLAEVELGKLALQKSKNDDVRTFAQKMVDDHTKLMGDMKPFADKMGVPQPKTVNAEQKATMTKLRAKSGKAFDEAYVKDMVEDHHKDLKEFDSEINSTQNSDLKSTVTSGRDVVKMHSDMIEGIAGKMNISTSM